MGTAVTITSTFSFLPKPRSEVDRSLPVISRYPKSFPIATDVISKKTITLNGR